MRQTRRLFDQNGVFNMSMQEIHVPDIGDFDEVEVIEVLVSVGDSLAIDDAIITLESDKASMDIPSPVMGKVREIKVNVGDKVAEGSVVVILETALDAASKSAPDAKTTGESSPAAAVAPVIVSATASALPSFDRVHASPSIRRIAREKNVDLMQVVGSGRKGRVTVADIDKFLSGVRSSAPTIAAPISSGSGVPPIPTQDFSKYGEIELLPLNKIKRLTGINLSRSWLNVPHVTHNDEADITELDQFRKSLKAQAEKDGVRITLLAFVMKALADSLRAFPNFNSSLDETGENLILKKYLNIGIAVDTPNGLVVPVIKDVANKGIFELSTDLMSLSGKARDKKLKPADMSGGSMTISSLGGIGGTSFTPIVNAPEVAILGLTRSYEKPFRGANDEIVWKLMQPMSLSYDHRVIDGAEAARFSKYLGERLTDIRLLLA
jgi:pyruvate dehydrogenase E2 component (dihydrolipoamide acetyltransferase)